MTRLPAVTARELVAVAEKLGFVLDRQKGSHAVFIRAAGDEWQRIVVPIHKGRSLKRGTLHGLIADMGITVEEFVEML
jgi:hypothetical protein